MQESQQFSPTLSTVGALEIELDAESSNVSAIALLRASSSRPTAIAFTASSSKP
jgi:hypothetical protein